MSVKKLFETNLRLRIVVNDGYSVKWLAKRSNYDH